MFVKSCLDMCWLVSIIWWKYDADVTNGRKKHKTEGSRRQDSTLIFSNPFQADTPAMGVGGGWEPSALSHFSPPSKHFTWNYLIDVFPTKNFFVSSSYMFSTYGIHEEEATMQCGFWFHKLRIKLRIPCLFLILYDNAKNCSLDPQEVQFSRLWNSNLRFPTFS